MSTCMKSDLPKGGFLALILGPIALAVGLSGCKTPGTDAASLVQGLEGCGGEHLAEPQYVPASVLDSLTNPADAKAQAASDRVSGRKPLLIYLAVDTAEPFMKLAVDHELHALRAACDQHDERVNWIAWVNSHLTLTKSGANVPVVMRCDGGQYKVEALAPELAKRLEQKRSIYAAGKKCADGPNPLCLRISQPFAMDKAAEFKDYPLAHPDIVLDLLEASRALYPATKFTYFVHLKSHGSEDFVTTGLGPEQVAEKSKCQADVMSNLYKNHPELFLPAADSNDGSADSAAASGTATNGALGQIGLGQIGLGQIGLGQVGLGQVGLGQIGLGQVGLGQIGLGQVGLGQVGLGQVGLGQVGLGAGGSAPGLGKVGGLGLGVAGLGATNHYGTRHLSALLALRWFTTKGTGQEDLGFVYFESCESRASRFLQSQSQNCALPPSQNPLTTAFNSVDRMHAYYSAAQSLWYRNLDWDLLFDKWRGGEASVRSFQQMMIDTTKLVPNYDFAKQDPLPLCH